MLQWLVHYSIRTKSALFTKRFSKFCIRLTHLGTNLAPIWHHLRTAPIAWLLDCLLVCDQFVSNWVPWHARPGAQVDVNEMLMRCQWDVNEMSMRCCCRCCCRCELCSKLSTDEYSWVTGDSSVQIGAGAPGVGLRGSAELVWMVPAGELYVPRYSGDTTRSQLN